MIVWYLDAIYMFICLVPSYIYFISYLIHATPVYLSLCLRCFNPLFTINTFTVTIDIFILLLLLLFYWCHQITVTTDKLLQEKSFSGVVELTTQLLRLINILWLPLCWINQLGSNYPRRLLRSPTLVGHHHSCPILCALVYRCPNSILRDQPNEELAHGRSPRLPNQHQTCHFITNLAHI